MESSYPTSIQLRRQCLGMTSLQLQCFAKAVDEYAQGLIQELRTMAQRTLPVIQGERDFMLRAFADRWHRILKENKELPPHDRSLPLVEKVALADVRTLLESPPHGFHWEEQEGIAAPTLGFGHQPRRTILVIIS